MTEWKVKKDNYGFTESFTITNVSDGNAKDLTGYTVTLKVWRESTLKFSEACILDADPTTGICTYVVQITDFDTVGYYYGELELTKVGEKVDTLTFDIVVQETAP